MKICYFVYCPKIYRENTREIARSWTSMDSPTLFFLNCPCSVNLLMSLSVCYITVCLSIYHLIFITFKITVWRYCRQYGDIFKLTKKYSQVLSRNASFVTFKLYELSKSQELSLTQIPYIPMISMDTVIVLIYLVREKDL